MGSTCPAGDWADGLADDGTVLFVRPGATGGDGTRALPYGSVTAALSRARPGMTIALARGRLADSFPLPAGVTLRGACAGGSEITASAGATVVAGVLSAGGMIRDLTITGQDVSAIVVQGSGASAHLEGVIIERSGLIGLQVDGGRVTADRLVVRDTVPRADGLFGVGVQLQRGGSAELSHVVISGNRANGVLVSGAGSDLRLTDAHVHHNLTTASDSMSTGALFVALGASARVERSLFEANPELGLLAKGAGSTLELEDVVVRRTLAATDGTAGEGIHAESGGRVTGERVHLTENESIGAGAHLDGAHIELTDVVIRENGAGPDTDGGAGVFVGADGSAALSRAFVAANVGGGLHVRGAGAVLDAAGLRVRDTRFAPAGVGGRALEVDFGARATLHDVVIEHNESHGVFTEAATLLQIEDAVIRDGVTSVRTVSARGMNVRTGAQVVLARVLFERSQEIALFALDEGTRVTATDLVVRDTRGSTAEGLAGWAVGVGSGAAADVSRALLETSHEAGVFAHGAGSLFDARDVVIRDTASRECAATTCAGYPAGSGVGAFESAHVRLSEFVVTRAEQCGVIIGRDGMVDLRHGVVSEHPIGVCIQVDGYDVGRLTDRVLYRDNEAAFEATTYPAPDVADPDIALEE